MKNPLLVSNPANIFYLTGIEIELRDAWVLATEEETHFFTDARYKDILQKFFIKKIPSRFGSPIIPHEISSSLPLSAQLQQILSDEKTNHIFFEADNITVLELATLKKKISATFKPTSGVISHQREVKNSEEITKIKKACETIDACLHDIKKLIRPGVSEYEIAFKLDSWLREKGFTSAFPPIVAADEDAAVPHFNTQLNGNKRISQNAIVLIDAGAKVDGYCSDISRMFVVGKASSAFTKTYNNMRAVQEQTIKKLGSSKTYSEIDLFCREELEKARIVPHSHATGHGIGIDVHEKPYVSFNSQDKIRPGHAITIEPGTYIEGKFGIRIEDTVLIDEKGLPVTLTKFPK